MCTAYNVCYVTYIYIHLKDDLHRVLSSRNHAKCHAHPSICLKIHISNRSANAADPLCKYLAVSRVDRRGYGTEVSY